MTNILFVCVFTFSICAGHINRSIKNTEYTGVRVCVWAHVHVGVFARAGAHVFACSLMGECMQNITNQHLLLPSIGIFWTNPKHVGWGVILCCTIERVYKIKLWI